jgi:hypothetical protein
MERADGLLLGGVALVVGSLRRLQNDAVDMARRDIGLNVRRHLGHSRRLARDSVALVQLVIGVAILIQGLRTALREWSADAEGAASVGTDIESIA